MIIARKIPIQIAEHFEPDGTSLGFLNEVESMDLRIQIAQEEAIGYYLVWEGEKVFISPDGEMPTWPPTLWNTLLDLYVVLLKIRKDQANQFQPHPNGESNEIQPQ